MSECHWMCDWCGSWPYRIICVYYYYYSIGMYRCSASTYGGGLCMLVRFHMGCLGHWDGLVIALPVRKYRKQNKTEKERRREKKNISNCDNPIFSILYRHPPKYYMISAYRWVENSCQFMCDILWMVAISFDTNFQVRKIASDFVCFFFSTSHSTPHIDRLTGSHWHWQRTSTYLHNTNDAWFGRWWKLAKRTGYIMKLVCDDAQCDW